VYLHENRALTHTSGKPTLALQLEDPKEEVVPKKNILLNKKKTNENSKILSCLIKKINKERNT
jgi:hypothetical protein